MYTTLALLTLLSFSPYAAAASCAASGDESITVRVTAEFNLLALTRAPRSRVRITASTEFAEAYTEYQKILAKSVTEETVQIDGPPPYPFTPPHIEPPPHLNTPPYPDPPPHQDPEQASYSAFGVAVSADLAKVFSTVRHYSTTRSSTVIRESEVSEEETYHPGFLQVFRKLTYHVTIGGVTAHLEEENLHSSVAVDNTVAFSELNELGKRYISDRYGAADGRISGGNFVQTKCYKILTNEETDRLTNLENKVTALERELTDLERELTAQENKLTAQESQLTDLERDLTALRLEVAEQDDEMGTLNQALTAQNNETTSLKEALNTKITSLNDTMSAQDEELEAMIGALTDKDIELMASVNAQERALESKADRSVVVGFPNAPSTTLCHVVTCTGSTGRGSTTWGGSGGFVYTIVDITTCGFTDTPIITTTLAGEDYSMYMQGGVDSVTSRQIQVYLYGWVYTSKYPTGLRSWKPSGSTATQWKWVINYVATGNVCR